ncbi:MAG TPA: Ig-like domain-containing protein [Candidatus Blautia faecigallinarum]|uniref:Ig-like domain-containing protein n=1 Tax=Candidatus Blautia faecigallinarum TaxID=2838488 RepID=A0A9D2DSW8_9FIRM|nr:Ig-like domain-containing protein [Candidatus Blautia faecigallinarum]
MKRKQVKNIFIALALSMACTLGSSAQVLAASPNFYKGHRYQAFDDTMQWSAAKLKCQQRGGHLVTITSPAEQKFIEKMISKKKRDIYWIGLYKQGSTKKWVTNEKVSYLNIEKENYGQNYFGIYSRDPKESQQEWEAGQWYDHDNILRKDFWDYTRTGYICEWETTPLSFAKISLKNTVFYYDGKAKKPAVKVTVGGSTLKKGRDYTLSYSSNKKVGTAKVTITGKGSYTGSVTKTFKILKPAIKLSASSLTLSPGKSRTISASLKGIKGDVTWSTSNKNIASVSQKGVVKGKRPGTVYITARVKNLTAKCKVIVK